MYGLSIICLSLVSLVQSIFNCTRYQQPCQIEAVPTCCGYPLFDCISSGIETTCESLNDFPELEAEFVMRVREAKDRGQTDITLEEVRKDVNGLLGTQGWNGTSTTRRVDGRTTERYDRRYGNQNAGRPRYQTPRPMYSSYPRRREQTTSTTTMRTTSSSRRRSTPNFYRTATEMTTTTEEENTD